MPLTGFAGIMPTGNADPEQDVDQSRLPIALRLLLAGRQNVPAPDQGTAGPPPVTEGTPPVPRASSSFMAPAGTQPGGPFGLPSAAMPPSVGQFGLPGPLGTQAGGQFGLPTATTVVPDMLQSLYGNQAG